MNNSVQEEFISTVSHELRTPLTSIRGFSQTLLNSWDKIGDDDKKKFIGIIEEQSNRLIHLVENILSVSKLNTEKQVLKRVEVNSAVKKTTMLFPDANIKLNLYNGEIYAHLDEDKFQQIMTNLIDNAIKYSPDKSEVTVSTNIAEDKISIKVKDCGIGIKKEDLGKLYKKFCRLENHLTSKTQGNGLGLYITKNLAEKMNGEISVVSEENAGTTFELKFPFYNQEEVLKCSRIS